MYVNRKFVINLGGKSVYSALIQTGGGQPNPNSGQIAFAPTRSPIKSKEPVKARRSVPSGTHTASTQATTVI